MKFSIVFLVLFVQVAYSSELDFYDVHMHVDHSVSFEEDDRRVSVPQNYDSLRSRPGFLGGFVLSSTYRMNPTHYAESEFVEINRQTAGPLEGTQMRLLCGLSNTFKNPTNFLEECLGLEHAVGVKMRSVLLTEKTKIYEQDPFYLQQFQIVESAMETMNRLGKGIFLVHFSRFDEDRYYCSFKGSSSCLRSDAKNLRSLIRLLEKYPNVTLIVGHSGVDSFVGLEGLKQIRRSSVYDRVFVDTSASFSMASSYSWSSYLKASNKKWAHLPDETFVVDQKRVRRIIKAWKNFGVDRILYGSDQALGKVDPKDLKAIDLERGFIQDTQILSEGEKIKIFSKNFKGLLEKIDNKKSR